jgi:hypothetical protein
MQGLSSSLQEAKSAAQHLAESLSRLHHKHHLREDYDKLLAQAGAVLRQVEQVCARQAELQCVGENGTDPGILAQVDGGGWWKGSLLCVC